VADVVDRTVKSDSGADLVGSAQRPQIAAIAQIATPGADQAGVVLAVQVDQADLEGVELDVAVDGPAAVFFVTLQAVPVGGAFVTTDDVIGTGNTPVGGIIADVTRVGRAGGLVGVVDAAAGGSGAAGGNGVTAASIGGAELEAA